MKLNLSLILLALFVALASAPALANPPSCHDSICTQKYNDPSSEQPTSGFYFNKVGNKVRIVEGEEQII